MTVRQLDRWRATVEPTVLADGQRMLGDLAGIGPLRTRVVGIALAVGGVLAMLEPEGVEWDRVHSVAGGRARAVLHATLVHFTAGVDDARSLLAWAERASTGERIVLDRIAFVRCDFDLTSSRMVPSVLHEV